MNFNDLKKIVQTARDPVKGKPTEDNTRVRVVKGTASDPEILAVRFHDTDILRYYPDGRMELVTGWESSPTTNQRIRQYSGIRRYMQKLPTFHGRLPDPKKVVCVSHNGSEGHIISNSVGAYIEYRPDGTINMNSIRAKEFHVWKDQKTHRQLMAKGLEICRQVEVAQRLGYRFINGGVTGRADDWLEANLETPLNQIDVSQIPTYGSTLTNGLLDLRCTLQAISWVVARRRNCLETIALKNFSR